jgi:serine/threonine-protein kinase
VGGALTGSGQLVGTPAYLAPEQARGLPVGPATDQFALAVTAYEALTGARPWAGSCFSEVIASLLRDAPAPVSSVADVPKEIDEVLARALAKEPTQRFADIGELADALEDASRTLEVDPVASTRAHSRRSNAITHPDPRPVSVPAALTPPSPVVAPASAEPSPAEGVKITTTGNNSVEVTGVSPVAERLPTPDAGAGLVTTGDALRDLTANRRKTRTASFVGLGAVALLGVALWMWSSSHRDPVAPAINTTASAATIQPASSSVTPVVPTSAPATTESAPPIAETSTAASNATPSSSTAASTAPKRPAAASGASVVTTKPSATAHASNAAASSSRPATSSTQPASKPSATSTGRRVREDL